MIHMGLRAEMLQFHIGEVQTLERMPDLPVDQPFSQERITFLDEVSKYLLADKEARGYSDVMTFAFWIRKGNMEREKQRFNTDNRLKMGRGLVFHITPSNVAVNYAYSFAVSFVLGNANIVRLPSRTFPQVDVINRVIRTVLEEEKNKKWREYVVFLRYERNREINDALSAICDVRIIWGGDTAIKEIRKSQLPPRAGEITFGDRYSICILDAGKYLEIEEKERLALDFYNDTYLSDQNACTAPRLICWMGKQKDISSAKEIFWEKLWKVVAKKYTFQAVQYVDKLTICCLAATAMEGIHVIRMSDNRIVRIEMEKLSPIVQVYRGDSGVFYEYEMEDAIELMPICNGKLQTIALLGNEKVILQLIQSGVKGIDRVTRIGHTMDFAFNWDGYDLRERLTREISVS